MNTRIYSLLILFLTFGLAPFATAQKQLKTVDRMMVNCPGSAEVSTTALTQYIAEKFKTEEERLRAVYTWLGEHIRYDVTDLYRDDVSNDPFLTGKGVCRDYVELFLELSKGLGIEARPVQGYTKQLDQIILQPHVWVLAKIDHEWYGFDPTWGAGYIEKGAFIKKRTNAYFKIPPTDFIKTHLPYDPFWQVLESPVAAKSFEKPVISSKLTLNTHFSEDLIALEALDDLEQIKNECDRIAANGIENFLSYFILREKKLFAKSLEHQIFTEQFLEAQYAYEDGVFALNEFISYRNNYFEPLGKDQDLKRKIGALINHFETAQSLIGDTGAYPESIRHSAENLLRGITMAMINVREHKEFVKLYTDTPVEDRKSLFFE